MSSANYNIPEQVNQTANKGVHDAMYGKVRTEQESKALKDETIPAYTQQAKATAQDAQRKLNEQLPSSDSDPAATAKGYTEVAKNKAADVTAEMSRNVEPQVNAVKENASALVDEAKTRTSEATSQVSQAADNLQRDAAAKKDQAVAQGQADVQDTKAQSKGYIDSALSTAQSYVQAGQARLSSPEAADPAQAPGMIMSTVQSAASIALDTASRGIALAQSAVQPSSNPNSKPLTETAKEKSAAVVDQVASTAQGVQNTVKQNATTASEGAKLQSQSITDAAHQFSAGTIQSESDLKPHTEGEKGKLTTSRPPEPLVELEGAAKPYEDTSKPKIETPEKSL